MDNTNEAEERKRQEEETEQLCSEVSAMRIATSEAKNLDEILKQKTGEDEDSMQSQSLELEKEVKSKLADCPSTSNIHGSENKEEEEKELRMWSKKLQMIHQYMIFPKEKESYPYEARNLKELKDNIEECMRERREYVKAALVERKERSLLDWAWEFHEKPSFVGHWRSYFLSLVYKTTKIGLLVSLCLNDVLFLACTIPKEGLMKRYRKYFKSVIEAVIECQGETPSVVLQKVVSLLEYAEKELEGMGILNTEMLGDDDVSEDVDRLELGVAVENVLDELFQQVLMFEAALNCPINASLDYPHDHLINNDLSKMHKAFNSGEEEIEKLSSRVGGLKAMQEERVYFLMGQFQLQMAKKTLQTWKAGK